MTERTVLPPRAVIFVSQGISSPSLIPQPEGAAPVSMHDVMVAEINDALAAMERDADDAEAVAVAQRRHLPPFELACVRD
ncbi:MAG: hypothetical protein ACYDAR_17960 [Thermomicrobiales bacterium]